MTQVISFLISFIGYPSHCLIDFVCITTCTGVSNSLPGQFSRLQCPIPDNWGSVVHHACAACCGECSWRAGGCCCSYSSWTVQGAVSIADSFVRIIIMYFRSVLWMPNGILLPLALNLACRRVLVRKNLWYHGAGGEFPLVRAFYFISVVHTYSY